MALLSFSNTSKGRIFALSLIIYTVYSLTSVLRWLPVIEIQLPIIVLCYVLLLLSCDRASAQRVIGLSIILILIIFSCIFKGG